MLLLATSLKGNKYHLFRDISISTGYQNNFFLSKFAFLSSFYCDMLHMFFQKQNKVGSTNTSLCICRFVKTNL